MFSVWELGVLAASVNIKGSDDEADFKQKLSWKSSRERKNK